MRYLILTVAVLLLVGCAGNVSRTAPYQNAHIYACPNELSSLCYSTAVAPSRQWYQSQTLSFEIPKSFENPLRQGKLVMQEYYVPLLGHKHEFAGPVLVPLALKQTKVIRLENFTDQELNIMSLHLLTTLQPSQDLSSILDKIQRNPADYFGNAATRSVLLLASEKMPFVSSAAVKNNLIKSAHLIYVLVGLKLYNGNEGYLLYSLARLPIKPPFVLTVEQKLYSESERALRKVIAGKFKVTRELINSVRLN
ncbi:hypothetical protein BGC07_06285 [Piscirickettsia litoralis]|uniref:Lipoprotein n=1 Tax=Piscirickettsia litoralis TaxID=1891921 RepID=A0ABX3A8V8_9GAMM|nr:hypothetical protein BGC07_06285 [Piscirickettsia litoralis]